MRGFLDSSYISCLAPAVVPCTRFLWQEEAGYTIPSGAPASYHPRGSEDGTWDHGLWNNATPFCRKPNTTRRVRGCVTKSIPSMNTLRLHICHKVEGMKQVVALALAPTIHIQRIRFLLQLVGDISVMILRSDFLLERHSLLSKWWALEVSESVAARMG